MPCVRYILLTCTKRLNCEPTNTTTHPSNAPQTAGHCLREGRAAAAVQPRRHLARTVCPRVFDGHEGVPPRLAPGAVCADAVERGTPACTDHSAPHQGTPDEATSRPHTHHPRRHHSTQQIGCADSPTGASGEAGMDSYAYDARGGGGGGDLATPHSSAGRSSRLSHADFQQRAAGAAAAGGAPHQQQPQQAQQQQQPHHLMGQQAPYELQHHYQQQPQQDSPSATTRAAAETPGAVLADTDCEVCYARRTRAHTDTRSPESTTGVLSLSLSLHPHPTRLQVMKYQDHLARLSSLAGRGTPPGSVGRSSRSAAAAATATAAANAAAAAAQPVPQQQAPQEQQLPQQHVYAPSQPVPQQQPQHQQQQGQGVPASTGVSAAHLHADVLAHVSKIEQLQALITSHLDACEAAW